MEGNAALFEGAHGPLPPDLGGPAEGVLVLEEGPAEGGLIPEQGPAVGGLIPEEGPAEGGLFPDEGFGQGLAASVAILFSIAAQSLSLCFQSNSSSRDKPGGGLAKLYNT